MSNSVRPHRRQPTRLSCPWDSPGKNTGVGCHFLLQCMKMKSEGEVIQSSLTLFSSAQSLGRVQLFATPWTEACQASLSITNSQSLLKLMCIKLVMPSNHLILCCPLLLLPSIFPSIRGFSNESVLHIRWLGVSALASVLPMNIQNCCPLGLTGNSLLLTCISLSALSSHNASGVGDTIML